MNDIMMYSVELFMFNITMKMSITNSTVYSNKSSIVYSILVPICLSLIALITALGNIIVLLAFYCDNKLRTTNDYFILNMSIADFLVGSFCIPFYIPYCITQSWPFGNFFCKIWVTIDDVATMASVINIVAISVNRYWSIAYPISYRKYVRQHLVYIIMAFVWFLSFINFAPGIWLLSLFNKKHNSIKNETHHDCSGDYNNSFVYMLIAQFNYFIWPFILLCILNILIVINIWKRTRKISRLMSINKFIKEKDDNLQSSQIRLSKDMEDDQSLSILSKPNVNLIEKNHRILKKVFSNKNFPNSFNKNNDDSSNNSQYTTAYLSSSICQKTQYMNNYSRKNSSKTSETNKNSLKRISRSSPIISLSQKPLTNTKCISEVTHNESLNEYQFENENEYVNQYENDSSKSNLRESRAKLKSKQYRQIRLRIIRDRKAARSLFILVIVFLLFLFPYVICATASTAGINVSTIIFEISFWLLWMNSTCNPFLYPFIQIKYRQAYINLFQSFKKYFFSPQTNNHF